MSREELIQEVVSFLCDAGLYIKFEEFLMSKGYTQDEINEVLE